MKAILFILISFNILFADLTRSGDIVSDSHTGLQWQDNEIVETAARTWQAAIDYCENTLTLGEHNDWRLPNKKELLSIADRSRYSPAIDTAYFLNTASSRYWSSTTSAYNTSYAWYVYFKYGSSVSRNKANDYYVRCVRGGQFGHLTCPEGQHLKQGERGCIPGTPAPDPGPYPDNPCSDNQRLIQGTGVCESATPVVPPGFALPTCPDGERLTQGTEQCELMDG